MRSTLAGAAATAFLAATTIGFGPAAGQDQGPHGRWTVEALQGSDLAAGDPHPSLEIAEGRAGGWGGCNRYSGVAMMGETRFAVVDIASTAMLCPPDAMRVEDAFMGGLAAATGWRLEGGRLILTDASGNELMRLVAADAAGAELTIRVPGADAVQTARVVYSCDGLRVEVEYVNAGPVSLALLTMGDTFVVASNVLSASGARYAGDRFVWWSRGQDEASLRDLTAGEEAEPVACAAIP